MAKPPSPTRWRDKRDRAAEAQIVDMIPRGGGPSQGRMVIGTPRIFHGLVLRVPRGGLALVGQLMDHLAEAHGADAACPMTSGIFLNIVAKAAEEERAAGAAEVAPWWRVLKAKGALNPKYPGGQEAQAALLEAEGHAIDRRRVTWRVQDYEAALTAL